MALLGLAPALAMALFAVYLSAGPLHTDDLWFHLRMGEHFASEGLRSGWDPILHTAHDGSPVAHEWLFDVAVHGVDALGGFVALRALHGAAVAGILAFAFALLRREGRSLAVTGPAFAVFVALSWWRLAQLRPDLWSVAACFGVFALLLADGTRPSWKRVAATCALLVVWVNAHSAFLLGPLLIAAGAVAAALRALLRARVLRDSDGARREAAVARRLGAAFGLGFAATLANPRGLAQHGTFFHMRAGSVLPARDDWAGLSLVGFEESGGVFGPVEWGLSVALAAALAVAGGAAVWRLARAPDERALALADPLRGGLAVGWLLAMLVAVRFSWLCLFPLLFLLRAERIAAPAPGRAPVRAALAAAVSLAVAVAFFGGARYRSFVETDFRVWRSQHLAPAKYAQVAAGLRFLAETGVEGNLFNSYSMGAFLGYWLAPRVRAFIDGRNEAYPPAVFRDYALVTLQRGGAPGRSYLELLDAREVDLFFGTGLPYGQARGSLRPYTTEHLWGAPGWIPVFRAVGQSVSLRRHPRNDANLRRIAAYYARAGVPFDRERGLDVDAVVRERPDWAEAHQLLPVGTAALREAAAAGPPRRRAAALEALGVYLTLAGAWEHAVEVERERLALAPGALAAHRRLVHALLRLDRLPEALAAAAELDRRAPPTDRVSAAFVRAARQLARLERRAPEDAAAAAAVLAELPLVERADAMRLLAGRYRGGELDASRLRAAVADGDASGGA